MKRSDCGIVLHPAWMLLLGILSIHVSIMAYMDQ